MGRDVTKLEPTPYINNYFDHFERDFLEAAIDLLINY